MSQLFWYIYRIPVPLVLPIIAVVVLIWGMAMRLLARRSPKAVGIINCIALTAALGGILYITVFRNDPGKQELILQPFQSFIEAKQQKEMYRELLMNVLLFVPLGLSLPFVLTRTEDGAWRCRIRCAVLTVLIAVALSVAIEAVQYRFALGRCETDDVLSNTLGTFFGICAYLLQFIGKKTKKQNCPI
ncbi:MAG: VanZ family protein [Clostridia bacterium]|nr:VanZ family protein [Clostridia bacterium]